MAQTQLFHHWLLKVSVVHTVDCCIWPLCKCIEFHKWLKLALLPYVVHTVAGGIVLLGKLWVLALTPFLKYVEQKDLHLLIRTFFLFKLKTTFLLGVLGFKMAYPGNAWKSTDSRKGGDEYKLRKMQDFIMWLEILLENYVSE